MKKKMTDEEIDHAFSLSGAGDLYQDGVQLPPGPSLFDLHPELLSSETQQENPSSKHENR